MTTKVSAPGAATGPVRLLVATRKGAFILKSDPARRSWKTTGPKFLGHAAHHCVLDPRDRRTLLLAARTGHLGPTVFRSLDMGRTWKEAARPPAFPKAAEGQKGRVLDHVFWLTPGLASEPGAWYAGSSPQGLFRSEDGGVSWAPVSGLNDHPMLAKWTGGEQDGTPDGPKLHSVLIDPRDARHLYVGMSSGGVFESRDQGKNWQPLNAGCLADFLPTPYPEYGQDPHCVRLHPLAPDILYQQNHCGIYRMARPEDRWVRIGASMPKKVGDIGFPMVLHPRDPDTAWTFPMDGGTVWPRTSPGGRPAVYGTRNAGRTWQRLAAGLPAGQAWLTVKRQAMCADLHNPVGIYFGTTNGEIWASRNEGAKWACIVRHLPHVYAVEAVELRA
ncbi:MAG TPA: glycosyl hydrolase [Burkholderiales bacterium]|nr:glycosyl hydrolase [Burkholderiales bacterium]